MPVSLIIVFTEGDMNNKQKKIELNNCISYKFKSKQKQTTPQNICASTYHTISHKIYQRIETHAE